LDSVTHTLKPISRIKIKERIKNKRIYLNWSKLILYSYAKQIVMQIHEFLGLEIVS
jgi:RNA-binding protein YlmH